MYPVLPSYKFSSSFYSYSSKWTSYSEAIKVLEAVFVKFANEIFVRHKLATFEQLPSETIDRICLLLKLLAKDCVFKGVMSDEAAGKGQCF